jgi:hypothetical protein
MHGNMLNVIFFPLFRHLPFKTARCPFLQAFSPDPLSAPRHNPHRRTVFIMTIQWRLAETEKLLLVYVSGLCKRRIINILCEWFMSSKYYIHACVCEYCEHKAKAVPLHDTQALRGRGAIAPTHSRPRHYMGVSGQRDAPAALYPQGKDRRYPLYRRLGGP